MKNDSVQKMYIQQVEKLSEKNKYREMFVYTYLGAMLRAARKECGLTLEQVADQIGSTKSYMHELENADSVEPGLSIIKGLCRVYNIDPRDFISYGSR